MLNEVYRTLTPSGTYICVSYGFPQNRESYFKNVKANSDPIGRVELEALVGESDKAHDQSDDWRHERRRTGSKEFPLYLHIEETVKRIG